MQFPGLLRMLSASRKDLGGQIKPTSLKKTSTTMDLLSLVTIDTQGITLGPECSGHHRRFVSALTLLTWQYLLPTHKSELCKSLRFSIRIDAVLGQYLQYLQHMSSAKDDIMMFEPKPNDKIPQINDIPSFTECLHPGDKPTPG